MSGKGLVREMSCPGNVFPGNILSGKRLSGKVIVQETSVKHAMQPGWHNGEANAVVLAHKILPLNYAIIKVPHSQQEHVSRGRDRKRS